MISARIFDLGTAEFRTLSSQELDFEYRSSNLRPTDVVVSADFRTEPTAAEAGQARLREITRWRRAHIHPVGDAAGRIIDELGLKGFRVGGASVSTKHANFFEAGPEATAQDVYDLVSEVRRQVAEKTGVDLIPEVQFAGPFA